MNFHSSSLLRKLMQAGGANSKEKAEPEYEEDEVVVVGTSTVLDNSSEEDTTAMSSLQKGKEQLKNVENVINNVSHKMKSNKHLNELFVKSCRSVCFFLHKIEASKN